MLDKGIWDVCSDSWSQSMLSCMIKSIPIKQEATSSFCQVLDWSPESSPSYPSTKAFAKETPQCWFQLFGCPWCIPWKAFILLVWKYVTRNLTRRLISCSVPIRDPILVLTLHQHINNQFHPHNICWERRRFTFLISWNLLAFLFYSHFPFSVSGNIGADCIEIGASMDGSTLRQTHQWPNSPLAFLFHFERRCCLQFHHVHVDAN